MERSLEMTDCNDAKVPTWITGNNGERMNYDRPASVDESGGISLDQMRDDECVIAPGAIYRADRSITNNL